MAMVPQKQTPAWEMHVLDRRRKIASLRVRGMTQREIALALPEEPNPIVNIDTGRPYDPATISRDLKKVDTEWREQLFADISHHKARHLAELNAVKRRAWDKDKLFYVLKALEQEANVLGLNEPQGGGYGINVNIANFDLGKVPTDDLRRMAQVIDSARGDDAPAIDGERIIEAG